MELSSDKVAGRVIRILAQHLDLALRWHPSTDTTTLTYNEGIVHGIWPILEHLCRMGRSSLLRERLKQRTWFACRSLEATLVEQTLQHIGSPYLCGAHPTVADLYVSVYIVSKEFGNDDSMYPATIRWIDRVRRHFAGWVDIQCELWTAGAPDEATCSTQDEEEATSVHVRVGGTG